MKKPLARLLLCGVLALAAGAATVKMAAAGMANPGNVAANIHATPSTAGLVEVRDRHFRRHQGGRNFHHVRPHYRHVRPHHRYVRPYRHYRGPRSGIYLGFGAPYYGAPYYRPPVYYGRPRYIGPRYRRLSRAHIRWCYRHYRSYRASDNTFQPYHGPRRQCRAPY